MGGYKKNFLKNAIAVFDKRGERNILLII